MSNLQHRQSKIQEKRKQTPWRDFVMEVCSWAPLMFYRDNGKISRYPESGRKGSVVDKKDYNIDQNISIEMGDLFFDNLTLLFQKRQKMNIMQRFENENCDFAESYGGKNCYLCFNVGTNVENILYTAMSGINLKNIYNSFSIIENCDNVYTSKSITESSNIFFCQNTHGSNNIWFSSNMLGCSECILCNGLINQSYNIENISYSKEEYFMRKKQILNQKNLFDAYHSDLLQIDCTNKVSENVVGKGVVGSKNIQSGYFVNQVVDGGNLFCIGSKRMSAHNLFDCIDSGNEGDVDLYAAHCTGEHSSHIYSCSSIASCSNCYYSYYLESCSFCLGCIGLKNKSYCILNKQYSKEEWYEKADEIFAQMEKDGVLGQFFPATMNPFYFNDTAAYLIDSSFTKEEVTAKGYLWRDEPIKVDIPADAEVVKSGELEKFEGFDEQGNRTINADILKKVIQDEQGNYYRIIPMEYKFLMKHGLPLPRKHWLERMKENFRIN